ncbi:glycosyl transferase [Salinimicrobium marinum]|uniref:Glycosyl transferase n=1 Tax=Salinimicrobium marinum TaxID=680283 RepID=A0A918W1N2_9FLAO|nr:glycosyltransferase [Salinimicrobium marinum]GHA50313.1 glycosyl transferase [Salinimicrobium marinum]
MRVLQLIDSLRPGGAERMAVSYANALTGRVEGSFLCCTRMEGMLLKKLVPEVGYLFLEKKRKLDVKALFRLWRYIKDNNIDLIQAHSSSFFLGVLVKLLVPGVKLVWHDHFGRDLEIRKPGILKTFSKFFDGIISVNVPLKEWAVDNLNPSAVKYIKNFVSKISSENVRQENLEGQAVFNVVCLANLRPQKDHLNLLRAFKLISDKDLNLHLIGKDFEDSYSEEIRRFLRENKMENKVFLYGAQENVEDFLIKADIGVLSSSSEGLPVALLEYARAGLPVVCTRVGQCAEVVGNDGILVPSKNPEALAEAIFEYMADEGKRKVSAESFQDRIMNTFSEDAVLPEVLRFYKSIFNS